MTLGIVDPSLMDRTLCQSAGTVSSSVRGEAMPHLVVEGFKHRGCIDGGKKFSKYLITLD